MLDDGQAGTPEDSAAGAWQRIQKFFRIYVGERFRSFNNILIKRNLPAGSFTALFYAHPLVKYLGENSSNSKPAYLSAQNFSKVMLDLLTDLGTRAGDDPADAIRRKLEDAGEAEVSINGTRTTPVAEDTRIFLKSIWADAQGDVQKFKLLLENWFDDTMKRSTGWYKQYTQFFLFFIGLGIAVAFNVDAVRIAGKLSKDPVLREQVVQQADAYVKAHPDLAARLRKAERQAADSSGRGTAPALAQTRDSLQTMLHVQDSLLAQSREMVQGDIGKVNGLLGLGYRPFHGGFCATVKRLACGFFSAYGFKRTVGWIITALAISLGAPFWFDLLNKLMQLRGTVKSGDEKDDKTTPETTINRKG